MKKTWSFLHSPYPVQGSISASKSLVISIVIGLFVAIVLYLIGLKAPSEFRSGRIALVSIFGFYSFVTVLLFILFIPSVFFKDIKDENWTLLKDIFYILSMLLVIAIGNYFIALTLYSGMKLNWYSFIDIIMTTLFIGILPVSFFLGLGTYRSSRKYQEESESLEPIPPSITSRNLIFTSVYSEDDLKIKEDDFLFAEAESNYVSIYFKEEGSVKHNMIRTTLKKVQSEIGDSSTIIKCHRSFIANFSNSKDFAGNSQGYVISFEGTDKVARVSRSFTGIVKKLFTSKA